MVLLSGARILGEGHNQDNREPAPQATALLDLPLFFKTEHARGQTNNAESPS